MVQKENPSGSAEALGGRKDARACVMCYKGLGAKQWWGWVSGFSRVGTVFSQQHMKFSSLPCCFQGCLDLVRQGAEQIPLCAEDSKGCLMSSVGWGPSATSEDWWSSSQAPSHMQASSKALGVYMVP